MLIATPGWVRDGGVAAHVQASAAVLAGRGLRVRVLAAAVAPDERIAGVELIESPALLDAGAPMSTRLGGALASPPGIVHLHHLGDPGLAEHLRASAPVVVSAHGYPGCTSGVHYFQPGQECARAHGPGCVPNLVARGCAHTAYRRTLPAKYRNATRALAELRGADLVVSYSSAVDRHLAANGLTRRAIVPYFPTVAARQGSGHGARRRVVFAGRIVALKGIDVLIRAARDVDAEFVVCGDGRRLEKARALARRLGVAERVRFTGWLAPEALARELADASVVTMPSLWPEPLGGVGIEALAAGRPVVASATGGIPDWLQDGVSGLCVAPGDERALARALNELLEDPARQAEMGSAGRAAIAARYSPERHLAALLEGYRTARARWQTAGCAEPR